MKTRPVWVLTYWLSEETIIEGIFETEELARKYNATNKYHPKNWFALEEHDLIYEL